MSETPEVEWDEDIPAQRPEPGGAAADDDGGGSGHAPETRQLPGL